MPPETMHAALGAAAATLAGCSASPRLDAELLLAHALDIPREALLIAPPRAVPAGFAPLISRRATGEPIAYILGSRAFWDMELAVSPAVLIPRPDSETLIEAAIAAFAGTAGPATILDLGTGSGALLLAALRVWPGATGIGIDRSAAALGVARANAERLGLGVRARLLEGDWTGTGGTFDLVLCNPPYVALDDPLPRDVIEHEPHGALFAGRDGLDEYRRLVPLLGDQIADGGSACVEIGATQAGMVTAMAAACGLAAAVRRDLSGRDRCLVLRHDPAHIVLGFARATP